jgi:hypothetical protein
MPPSRVFKAELLTHSNLSGRVESSKFYAQRRWWIESAGGSDTCLAE